MDTPINYGGIVFVGIIIIAPILIFILMFFGYVIHFIAKEKWDLNKHWFLNIAILVSGFITEFFTTSMHATAGGKSGKRGRRG